MSRLWSAIHFPQQGGSYVQTMQDLPVQGAAVRLRVQMTAVPLPGYQPPNMQAQMLPGMEGEMWIDTKTYQWAKETARVIRQVSIEGFLAVVEPGTQFEVEKCPLAHGGWQITHFSSLPKRAYFTCLATMKRMK